MGLLDNFFQAPEMSDPQRQGLLGAAFSLMQAKGPSLSSAIGSAGKDYMGGYQAAQDRGHEMELRRLQMDEYKRKTSDAQAQQQRAAQIEKMLADAANNPNADPRQLIAAGVPIDRVKALYESKNYGRDEVARTAEVEGPNGSKMIQGFDKWGGQVGQGAQGYVAPQLLDLGDRKTFAKPVLGQSFGVGMSPSEQSAANNRNQSLDLQRQRLQFDQAGGVAGTKPVKQGPMSVTLQKELLESDDTAQSSASIIGTLNKAKLINDTAYSGYAAKGRAVLASNMPWSSEGADATIDLDNMMTGQALESLKSVFGGMPTEGERKILLDMQASAEKTPAQRQAIMDRAISAATRRGEFAKRKAAAIRNGTYLTEGVSQAEIPKAENGGGADGSWDEPSNPKPRPVVATLPPANSANKGQRARDKQTGQILVSDGMQWRAE